MSLIRSVRQQLTVIDGGEKPASAWLDFPAIVVGRSPFDPSVPTAYRFAKTDFVKGAKLGRKQPTFEAWSLVFGRIPPIPNSFAMTFELAGRELSSLKDATSCFRGIKRPIGADDRGFDTVAFVRSGLKNLNSIDRWVFA